MKIVWKLIRIITTLYAGAVAYKIVMDYDDVSRGPFGQYLTFEQKLGVMQERNARQVRAAFCKNR